MPRALVLAITQLGDPKIPRVLGKSFAVTLPDFVVLGAAIATHRVHRRLELAHAI